MQVEVHTLKDGEDELLGTLRWDGSAWHCEPDTPRLRRLLDEPVYDREKGEDVTSADPERFLELMQFQYKSAYLRVSAPRREEKKSWRAQHKAILDAQAGYNPDGAKSQTEGE